MLILMGWINQTGSFKSLPSMEECNHLKTWKEIDVILYDLVCVCVAHENSSQKAVLLLLFSFTVQYLRSSGREKSKVEAIKK